ncbi:hypothetical protein GYMLUDRAFT_43129 [Collybiopsis luxurians FD-317 M1]|uniref:Uncharacterized protein n=1 Tax=Collybiopsis luxurians FD-317 M1 TaxID=944289 RepID=A0A0D0BYY0_9AGAR|nr:hypothetical protein GYMLUDRAFT_43129 [Collybiopsis luxurians FD-317 M1]
MANKRVDEEGPATVKKEKVKPSQETASASSSRSNLLDRLDAAANEIPAPSLILTQDPYDGGASQSQTQPSDYDPRFRVTIYGPGEDEKAEFMTRKKHTIKKVLAGACKSFGIDPTRAKLQQIVVVPDEVTEELVSHFYDCDNSETVGKAGIESNSNLRVVLEGDGLEEEENGWD